ncbi:hypothetical protein CGRA01v4_04403 [Colletotrichum graminicola]|nr:hypothetical protein CGRA01v4_04403 [Colletotrichum graminicola]
MSGTFGRPEDSASSGEEYEVRDILYDVNLNMLPPGVKNAVKATRQAMVDRLVTEVYHYFEALLQWTDGDKQCGGISAARSVCAHSVADCIRLQIGALFPALTSLGLWPKPAPADVSMSPAQLRATLLKIRLPDYENNRFRKSDGDRFGLLDDSGRKACGSFHEILKRLESMQLEHYEVTNETQMNHLQAQQAKIGLEFDFSSSGTFKAV